jgi:hypothetical protein
MQFSPPYNELFHDDQASVEELGVLAMIRRDLFSGANSGRYFLQMNSAKIAVADITPRTPMSTSSGRALVPTILIAGKEASVRRSQFSNAF